MSAFLPAMPALTSTPARITWDLSGLSPNNQKRFGIYYRPGANYTFMGLESSAPGVLIQAF